MKIVFFMILQLFRVQQWYKNLLIFLPLVFAGLVTDTQSILLTSLGFIALCFMSSANYILNDIIDKEKDSYHEEKKHRPIASGSISVSTAAFLSFLLAVFSLTLGILLSKDFFFILLIFFAVTQLYSLYFKKEIFADIIFISLNFVLRAISGAFILDVRLSPWLIVCTFFLSLFMVVAKRKADLLFLGKQASKHKEVLANYSLPLLNTLMLLATASLLLSYTLYSFLSIYPHLIYTLPFSLYVILRYFYLGEINSPIARKPELFYKDTKLLLGICLWSATVLYLISFS